MPVIKKNVNSSKKQFYFFVVFWIVFWLIIWLFFAKDLKNKTTNSFLYTNPLLNYEQTSSIVENKNINLEQYLKDYLDIKKWKNKTTHISVYFRNLNNWNRFGINEKEEFSPASLMKLPLFMSYYKLSEEYPNILKEKLLYIPDSFEEEITQNIKPEKTLESNKEYKIKDLLDYMILYSDNKSSILLENSIDIDIYKKSFTDVGIDFPEFKDGQFENNINIVEYSSFFRVLYNSSYLNRLNSEYVLNLLSKTTFTKWLKKWVPKETLVSHKFGERMINGEKQLHDCWIIYYPNHPYILCVMTRGRDWQVLENIISDISQKVYKELTNNYSQN